MRIRASVVITAVRAAAPLIAVIAGVACSHPSAYLVVDAPKQLLLPYQPPDIDELTGIESPEEPEDAGAGSAQNPQQAPRK
jgi:hypothetical protein